MAVLHPLGALLDEPSYSSFELANFGLGEERPDVGALAVLGGYDAAEDEALHRLLCRPVVEIMVGQKVSSHKIHEREAICASLLRSLRKGKRRRKSREGWGY